jgi:hypothetical protein
MTGLAWGSCGPAFSTVPAPPALNKMSLSVSSTSGPIEVVLTDNEQKRVGSTEQEVELGTVRLSEYPSRLCRSPGAGNCPLPLDKLRP